MIGILIASVIILLWFSHLVYILTYIEINPASPVFYLHILIQTYFYTGLFITGHDAMHRNISKNMKTNHLFGRITSFLFAGLSYKKLIANHFMHHKSPGETNDPDFYIKSQIFFIWWGAFLLRYVSVSQLLIMAVAFNLLKLNFPEMKLWLFWVLPAFLSTLQLFYFGTYQPHKYPHDHSTKPHNARTQKRNHLWAMLSCYFFGYHHEHHDSPATPWWKLYKLKIK